MKISELEYHHGEFMAFEGRIKDMLDKVAFPEIFSVCVESFPHIVPAIQYRKKRELVPETPDFLAFEVICKYAPPLFEHAAIESLFELVKSTRILAKHENQYLHLVESAIAQENLARILWNSIEQQTNLIPNSNNVSINCDQLASADIIDFWHKLGVIIRNDNDTGLCIRFRTRIDELVEGRCHYCGVQGKGRKELFFKSILCQKCGKDSYYLIKYSDTQ